MTCRPQRTALVPLACLCLAALVASVAGARESKQLASRDLRKWIDGPIRYIAESEEIKRFRRLESDEERVLFIERFWARRDPSRDTLLNEYRQIFWERVSHANRTFLDSPRPGWMTDRGKIYILYGPPTEIETFDDLDTRTRPDAGKGLIRWLYDGRPGGSKALAPTVVVPFVPDAGGEYRVAYDPKLSSVFLDALGIEERRDEQIDRYLAFVAPPTRSALSVMLDLGRMQEVPPQDQVILEQIETLESYEAYPLEVAVHRFEHPDDDGTVAIVTVDVTDTGTSVKPAIVARVAPLDATRPQRILGEGSFKYVSHGDRRYAQGRVILAPGEYALTVMVADPANIRTGMHRRRFEVDGPTDRLRFSDVVWAERLESLDYAVMASYSEPFLIGTFEVLPRVREAFLPGDTLRLFYAVYGASMPIRIRYTLEGRDLDGGWVTLGTPYEETQSSDLQGWSFPTSARWPLGAYRVRIDVTDADERLITRLQDFELVDDLPSPDATEPEPAVRAPAVPS